MATILRTIRDSLTLFFIIVIILPFWMIAFNTYRFYMHLKGYDYVDGWGRFQRRGGKK